MGYKVGKGYSPTFRDEVFSEVHIQNPARIPDVSEFKEERILVSALTLTRLRS
jgi:hypothetical protein